MDKVDLEIHFDGKFVNVHVLQYIGGQVKICQNYDIDLISYFELLGIVKEESKYEKVTGLFFRPYNKTLDVCCIPLNDDEDVFQMVKFGCGKSNTFDIYSTHDIEEGEEKRRDIEESMHASPFNSSDSDEELLNIRRRGLISSDVEDEVQDEFEFEGTEFGFEDNEVVLGEDTVQSRENENYGEDQLTSENETEINDYEGDIIFDDDKYKSDDDDRLCLDELEELKATNGGIREDSPYYNVKTPYNEVHLMKGMKFSNHHELRHALKSEAIAKGYVIKYVKSESTRLLAVCAYGDICEWRLWATKMSTENSFQIKSLRGEHTCIRDYNTSVVDSTWLARQYASKLRDNLIMKLKDIQTDALKSYGVSVTLNQCWRAKKKAVGEIEMDLENHYSRLYNYAEEIVKKNPGSTVVIDYSDEEGLRFFKRIYICLAGIKRAWKEHCRHVIGLDGCWLKGKCKGELLSAVGRDANDQMYPICWAVVEGESIDSWQWFIKLLLRDLGPNGVLSTGRGWTIISDQQKGLINAVNTLLPDAEHRNCAIYLC